MQHAPDDLKHWGLHCFCLGARMTPHGLVRQHGKLLFAAGTGVPISDVPAADLARLEGAHLLERDGERVRTAFPMIGPEATDVLRRRAETVAGELLARVRTDALQVVEVLGQEGFGDHAQAILFGHVLDGLAWDAVRRRIELPDTTLTPERTDWNGLFWALYPKLENAAGTNELTRGTASLVMVWNDRNADALRAIAALPETAVVLDGVTGAELSVVIGGDAVPVINPVTRSWLTEPCDRIAEMVASRMVGEKDLLAALAGHGVHLTASELCLVFGHELIWAMAAAIGAGELFDPPPLAATASFMFIRVG
jgi:hypothetical protein